MTPPSATRSGLLGDLLSRRILFVAGKGGTGKTSVAAALLLLAARQGKRCLGIEVDAKGDLAAALGAAPVGFEPEVVQARISVLALHPEDSLREYMRVFFKMPRFVSITPLSRIFDFIATSVPGPKDMLTIGKIAYEERQKNRDGEPRWDLIVVDCTATGHALPQILAAREMRKLARGGIVKGQLQWIEAAIVDHQKTALLITALPQEMPVVEAIELHDKALAAKYIAVAGCFLNRMPPTLHAVHDISIIDKLADQANLEAAERRVGGPLAELRDGLHLAADLRRAAHLQAKSLRGHVGTMPVVEIPLLVAKDGLATSRAVAAAIASGAA